MPPNRTADFPSFVIDMIDSMRRMLRIMPMWLGGTAGPGGGTGGPAGGFIGGLTQVNITYDTTEFATYITGSSPSIVDNLNHIRARLNNVESGSMRRTRRWYAPAGTQRLLLTDAAQGFARVGVNGFALDPIHYELSAERRELVFGTALPGDSYVEAEYLVLTI